MVDVRRQLARRAVKPAKLLERQPLMVAAIGGGLLLLWMAGKAAGAVAEAASTAASATVDAAAGIATGNNAVTQNATNAAGEKTTAYQGAGVLGTMGAATNAVLGGAPASLGEWIGGKVFEITHPSDSPDGGWHWF